MTDHFIVSTADGTEHSLVMTLTGSQPDPTPLLESGHEQQSSMASADLHMGAGTPEPNITELSPVDHYLQFAQASSEHSAPVVHEQGTAQTPDTEHSPVELAEAAPAHDYLQLAGVDPAHANVPEPSHPASNQPPPDSPMHLDAHVEDLPSSIEDGGLADLQPVPVPDQDPQHHS